MHVAPGRGGPRLIDRADLIDRAGIADDGAECAYGCGARVLWPGDVCAGCEDEATGRGDDGDEAIEMEYADGDYGW